MDFKRIIYQLLGEVFKRKVKKIRDIDSATPMGRQSGFYETITIKH